MPKDILLPLPVHPAAAPPRAVARALELAALLEAHVTALALEPKLSMPVSFEAYHTEMERILKARQAEVREAAQAALAAFDADAQRAGLAHEGHIAALPDAVSFDPVVAHARLHDLAVVPFVPGGDTWDDLVQALAFESGRPVLLMPEDEAPFRLDKVVIAWDFSRPAARAVGDALPLLRRAGEVRVVMAGRDRPAPGDDAAPAFAAHLARNGVNAALEDVALAGRSVGEALDAAAAGADLVVMGAFGHSRIRDFFLGGATTHVLKKPLRPTFLSH